MNTQPSRARAACGDRRSRPRPHRAAAAVLAALSVLAPGAAALPAAAATARPAGGGPARAAVPGGPQLAGHGIVVNYPAHGGVPRLPRVPASAYVIADTGTGQVLAARDPHGRYRPASTLKVLTAVALMPLLRPSEEVIASRRAARIEPSKVGLIAGQSYRVSDLFKALLMISANDAAIALTQATGSYRQGMAIINAQAHHLQADDTVAKRPNGLDAPGQHTSAYDEALFARAALGIGQFMRDEGLRSDRFRLRRHRWITLHNQNTMLDTFPGDLGGKIGWTTPAKATFIGWARRHGHTLVVTILHATPLTEMHTASKLLSWGFAADGTVRPVGLLVGPRPAVTAGPHRSPGGRHRLARSHVVAGSTEPATGPAVAGAAAFVAALLIGAGVVAAVRRWRGAGTRRAR